MVASFSYTTTQVAALTTTQVAALQTSTMWALNTMQVAALTTTQITVLTTSQLVALNQKSNLAIQGSSSQSAALAMTQAVALGIDFQPPSRAAFSKYVTPYSGTVNTGGYSTTSVVGLTQMYQAPLTGSEAIAAVAIADGTITACEATILRQSLAGTVEPWLSVALSAYSQTTTQVRQMTPFLHPNSGSALSTANVAALAPGDKLFPALSITQSAGVTIRIDVAEQVQT